MFYIFGDIHGCLSNLVTLFGMVKRHLRDDDILIFLGDYIDRGPASFEVVRFLISISENHNTVFLKGNHEDMFLKYLDGKDPAGLFFDNGGDATIQSYRRNSGEFMVPEDHCAFYNNLGLYHEFDDLIFVHAGFNPKVYNIEQQSEDDMLWIRDSFFRSGRRWEKTVIFGHTPTYFIKRGSRGVYIDDDRNIIGIDTGAVYGGTLTCLRWPDRAFFQS